MLAIRRIAECPEILVGRAPAVVPLNVFKARPRLLRRVPRSGTEPGPAGYFQHGSGLAVHQRGVHVGIVRNCVAVSTGSRGRATDNVFIDRLWRRVKYEEIYLKDYAPGADLNEGLAWWFDLYTHQRPTRPSATARPTRSSVASKGISQSPAHNTNWTALDSPSALCNSRPLVQLLGSTSGSTCRRTCSAKRHGGNGATDAGRESGWICSTGL